MANRGNNEEIGDADSKDVTVCVRTLNHTIGLLANRYGAASVVAALTEVVGCSSYVGDVSRGAGIRSLMKRIDVTR
jgi:hypothetical protein